MLKLSPKWIHNLVSKPETGMGYQVVTVVLKDGRRFDQVVVNGGHITQIKDIEGIPFKEKDIKEIIVTHEKWDFNRS